MAVFPVLKARFNGRTVSINYTGNLPEYQSI
jgi:hypothetical protein